MPTCKLTKRAIDAAKPGRADYFVWDSEVTGFGLRVYQPTGRYPAGRRIFVYKCRLGRGADADQRRIVIGEYGPLTVEQARREAQRMAGEVAAGRDPGATRNDRRSAQRAAREAPTVATLGPDFLADVRARRKATTADEYTRAWEKHIVPALGSLKVANVTPAHVAKLHRSMSKTPYMANRVLALLGVFFTFAEQQASRPRGTNPAHEVEFYPEDARERFLTAEELSSLGVALQRALSAGLPPAPHRRRERKKGKTAKHRPKSADTPNPADPFAVAAIRFLLLSGWRKSEVLTLKWSFLDLERGIATLPDTKTRRSVRPLGADALALLASLPRVEGSPYVFPESTGDARAPQPLGGVRRLWDAVRAEAELGDVRLHDLRHSTASVAASRGVPLQVVGKLLGHADATTTQRYAHLWDDPVQAAANDVSAEIAKLLGIAQPASADSPPLPPDLRIVRAG